METGKVERLIFLLRTIAERADAMTAGGMGLRSYAAVGRVFNDYVRQARELASAEMVNALEELDIPAEGGDPEAFLGELALRAEQIAGELEFSLAGQEEQDQNRDWEDTADALVRLKEAGLDVDDLVQALTSAGGPTRVDRRRVDWICKLAEAGIDVDSLIENPDFIRVGGQGPHHEHHMRRFDRRRRPRMHRGAHIMTVACSPEMCRTERGGAAAQAERTGGLAGDRSWRMDILSRVEKGEISPEEAADLLRASKGGDHEEI